MLNSDSWSICGLNCWQFCMGLDITQGLCWTTMHHPQSAIGSKHLFSHHLTKTCKILLVLLGPTLALAQKFWLVARKLFYGREFWISDSAEQLHAASSIRFSIYPDLDILNFLIPRCIFCRFGHFSGDVGAPINIVTGPKLALLQISYGGTFYLGSYFLPPLYLSSATLEFKTSLDPGLFNCKRFQIKSCVNVSYVRRIIELGRGAP